MLHQEIFINPRSINNYYKLGHSIDYVCTVSEGSGKYIRAVAPPRWPILSVLVVVADRASQRGPPPASGSFWVGSVARSSELGCRVQRSIGFSFDLINRFCFREIDV
jgi:hypothetical protein